MSASHTRSTLWPPLSQKPITFMAQFSVNNGCKIALSTNGYWTKICTSNFITKIQGGSWKPSQNTIQCLKPSKCSRHAWGPSRKPQKKHLGKWKLGRNYQGGLGSRWGSSGGTTMIEGWEAIYRMKFSSKNACLSIAMLLRRYRTTTARVQRRTHLPLVKSKTPMGWARFWGKKRLKRTWIDWYWKS